MEQNNKKDLEETGMETPVSSSDKETGSAKAGKEAGASVPEGKGAEEGTATPGGKGTEAKAAQPGAETAGPGQDAEGIAISDWMSGKKEKEPVLTGQDELKRQYRRGMRKGTLITAIIAAAAVFVAFFLVPYCLKQRQAAENGVGTTQTTTTSSGNASGDASGNALTISDVVTKDNLTKTAVLLQLLDKYYYKGMDATDLQDGLYKGLMEGTGDPYTTYYTKDEYEKISDSSSGEFSGIGIAVSQDSSTGYPIVSYVYPGSPAEDAGMKSGDLITKVDDMKVTSSMDLQTVTSHLRGEAGTDVNVTVYRGDQFVDMTITRAKIEIPSVVGQMVSGDVGYIRLVEFSGTTADQFMDEYQKLSEEGMQKMIIDLRDNGGGSVQGCADLLDDILPAGTTLTMDSYDGTTTTYTSDDENQIDMPIVVLVNENSASASEIFAAAIKDFGYGTLVGTKTYGKGVYQQVIPLTDGSAVKITVGKFYSPNGDNYNGVGIEPDVELQYENTAGSDAEYSVDTDNQIQKAIEILNQQS